MGAGLDSKKAKGWETTKQREEAKQCFTRMKKAT